MSTETTAMVPYDIERSIGIVSPLVDPHAAAQAILQYEALKQAIVQPGDVFDYKGRPFLKKSFWRRVATCFGLSLELVSEHREQDAGNKLAYSVLYRAVAPNGRTMIGDGYCSRSESGHDTWPEHTVRATAHTRAKNRAISDLVGGGEVSAEEIGDSEEEAAAPAPRQLPRRTVTPEPAPARAAPSPKYDIPHRWTEADKKVLFKRWQALQSTGETPQEDAALRGAGKFAAGLRAHFGHDAPFKDAERDAYAVLVTEMEKRRAQQVEADEPLTSEVEPAPFPMRDAPVGEIGA